jgi:plasmid stabilization system protein ParE
MNVEITARAERDVEEIYLWIRKDSPARAATWRRGLLKAAGTIAQFPKRCPLAPESGPDIDIRQLLYGKYRLLFAVMADTIYALHVRHAARRPLSAAPDDAEGDDED